MIEKRPYRSAHIWFNYGVWTCLPLQSWLVLNLSGSFQLLVEADQLR
jgi:hypothetical protein